MTSKLERSLSSVRLAEANTAKITHSLLQAFPLAKRSIPEFVVQQAAKYGSKKIITCDGASLTYEQLPQVASRWGAALTSQGVEKGDRVILMCSNCLEFIEIFLGCAWIGAIAVPINIASRGQQLQHMLTNCGAKIGYMDKTGVEALKTVDLQSLPLSHIYIIGNSNQVPLVQVDLHPLPATDEQIAAIDLGPADPVAILYTSGTTGMSKGVLCPHGQFFWWSVLTASQLSIVEEDTLHTTLPLFHVNALGCFFQALLYGATQVVSIRFSVTRFWDELIESQATVTYLLGAMVPMLLSKDVQPKEGEHNVRVALAPGVPTSAHASFMKRSAIVLLDGYGSTETNAVIGCNVHDYASGTMGRLKDGIEACVVDALDQPVPDGQPGELLLRSHQPFCFASGYFGMADKTVESWRNLWFHTGDNVIRTANGHFTFIDRAKDCIRRRGENISSFEVEQVLLSHPDISLAAVFAIPSELGEDDVMSTVVLEVDKQLTEEGIVRYCEGRLPYFCIPRFVDIVADLPCTESGKIKKFTLRERGKTSTTWDREKAGVVVRRE